MSQKNIIFSTHAKQQMLLRGVQEEEVISTIRGSSWKSAKRGKLSCKKRVDFGNNSPVNQQFYLSVQNCRSGIRRESDLNHCCHD